MIILQVTPLSQNFWMAGFEAIALMVLAAYVGWWLGRRTFALEIEGLKTKIRTRNDEVEDCYKAKAKLTPVHTVATSVPIPALVAVPAAPVVPDDLKIVEGIGPKIEELLNKEGILTFAQLATTAPERLKEILHAAGPRFQMHDPATWPEQSALARDGKWDELKKWQDELNKGRLE